jgi:hypothetical protein
MRSRRRYSAPPLCSSLWLPCEERIAVDGEKSRLVLATRPFEGVNWRANLHSNEADLFQHSLPGCTRQTTGNSSCPKIDIPDRRFGDGFAVRDVSELEPPPCT